MKRQLRNFRDYLYYILPINLSKNKADNHFVKRNRIISLQKKYKFNSFIETGTFYGQMSVFAASYFSSVYTVESFSPIYSYNRKNIHDKKIKMYFGKSVDLLAKMIDEANDNCMFWLDGHYSGPGTDGHKAICPILEELSIISKKNLLRFCILIDDLRCFDGTNNYPRAEDINRQLVNLGERIIIRENSDCIIAIKV